MSNYIDFKNGKIKIDAEITEPMSLIPTKKLEILEGYAKEFRSGGVPNHFIQQKILSLSNKQLKLTYTEIAKILKIDHPYKISYHLKKLYLYGYVGKKRNKYYKCKSN